MNQVECMEALEYIIQIHAKLYSSEIQFEPFTSQHNLEFLQISAVFRAKVLMSNLVVYSSASSTLIHKVIL